MKNDTQRKNRNMARDFLTSSFSAIGDEAMLSEMLSQCDSLVKNVGADIPPELDRSEKIRKNLAEITARRNMIELVMSGLLPGEKQVINGFFRDGISAEEIAENVCCERSEVYRIKDRALDKIVRYIGV